MANNKIVYGESILIDLTSDTVVADKLAYGYTAHDRSGNLIVGTYVEPVVNAFSLQECEYESNIISHTAIDDTGCIFTIRNNVTENSSVYFSLKPLRTYNFSWVSENCNLSVFNSDWSLTFNETGPNGLHTILNVTNAHHCYFYVANPEESLTATFLGVLITEV